MKNLFLVLFLIVSYNSFGSQKYNNDHFKVLGLNSIRHGFIPDAMIINKFGKNPDMDTGAEYSICNCTTYQGFPDGAETVQIFSDSANDTVAGTGARSVRVIGLDEGWNMIAEEVNLNGTTPVLTANTYRRIHSARVTSAGSSGVNAGQITARQSTTTSAVFFNMIAGLNQTNEMVFTIPSGYTGYALKIGGQVRSSNSAIVEGHIWTRNFGEVFRARRPFVMRRDHEYISEISGGLTFSEKSDIDFRLVTTVNNTRAVINMDILLIKNNRKPF